MGALCAFFLGAISDSYSRRDESATPSGRLPTNPPGFYELLSHSDTA